jgi:hypothetical protein
MTRKNSIAIKIGVPPFSIDFFQPLQNMFSNRAFVDAVVIVAVG